MVGFVFFPPSPRNLGIEAARLLGERVQGRAKKVALSVDATDSELDRVVEALRPDMLQLHGKETPERVAAVRSRFDRPVMKALPIEQTVGPRADPALPEAPTGCCSTAARRATRRGRAGSARRSTGRCSRSSTLKSRSCCRAGSTPGMSREALRITRASAVDVSSGVERAPGEKDAEKIRAFIRAAREAEKGAWRERVRQQPNSFRTGPDERGHFGIYGGRFVAET